MPGVVFAVIVVAFVVVALILVRRTQRGAFVERLPIGDADRRVVLATGGPEGKHKFVIVMILDYTTDAPPVQESGYAAYRRTFGLANGYPTYYVSAGDVTAEPDALHAVVPFPEAGKGWGAPPEVRLVTPNATRYEAAIVSAGRVSSASP